jgi:hypothetical protein
MPNRKENYAGSESHSPINKGKGAILVPGTVELLHHKED